MGLDKRKISKEIAGGAADGDPGDTANDTIADEVAVRETRTGCGKGRKGADDRHKAGQNNGGSPVAFKKTLSLGQAGLINQAAKQGMVRKTFANPVAN